MVNKTYITHTVTLDHWAYRLFKIPTADVIKRRKIIGRHTDIQISLVLNIGIGP